MKRKFSALTSSDSADHRAERPRSIRRTTRRRGWEKLPRDIQIHILGFQRAEDAIRLRPLSKLFATSGIEQLRRPNYAACSIAQKHSLRFLFVTELKLHRQVPIFNGACFPALEILELHTWYTSEVVTGEWPSLKSVNCYGSGDRSIANKWDFFSPTFNCPSCLKAKLTLAYDITLPGFGFPILREVTLEQCASFSLADVSPEEIDPEGFDDEEFNNWRVPPDAWDRVGEWPSVETIRVIKPGYGIALACVFPKLKVVEVEQSTGEPVLLAGRFPKLREIRVDQAGDVLLTGEFSTESPPKLTVKFPHQAPPPDDENLALIEAFDADPDGGDAVAGGEEAFDADPQGDGPVDFEAPPQPPPQPEVAQLELDSPLHPIPCASPSPCGCGRACRSGDESEY